ncbi:DUF4007 family protein [Gabonibacter chumensis]|uniref:DUF4007 family protein n=1 Tax=Gabonibacter chumensis TaxID=2972474 RepID=UPI00257353B4|nr:DUF4007 family protein [Gabonibacter chumensis]MCR9012143.1 DUF4007 family protein [Gabonibacter chumensis]
MAKPIFSGHESFACKSHWLKRGYDFVQGNNNFNNENAVVVLGVGKNMVSAIRFWMKAFGLIDDNGEVTQIARLLLANNGYDPYFEDMGSLWLMHFNIICNNYATAYKTTFVDYHQQRNMLDKAKLQNFIKHRCFDEANCRNLYNENTVKRDIGVLFHNYCRTSNISVEESNTLLAPLNLILEMEDNQYTFNYATRSIVPTQIFLYALLTITEEKSISFSSDAMNDLALIFCLTNNDLLDIVKRLCTEYSGVLVFSDVAGIKELQVKGRITKEQVLENYYGAR